MSFNKYRKNFNHSFPFPSKSSSFYHYMDETVITTFHSTRLSRNGMSSNESSPKIKFKLPSNDSTRYSPYQLRSARQLEYQAVVGSHSCDNIHTTISHSGSAGTKTESIQDCCLSQLQNQVQCQIPNRTDPTHSKDKLESTFSCCLRQ